MAAELMLINPRRRRHRRRRVIHARKNPRRRRMSALQRKYFGGGRKRRVIRARSNPRRRHHRRRHYTIMRRNPSIAGNPVGFVTSTIVPAALGAIGGVATNYIFDNYAPATFQTGILNPIARFGLAALLGVGVGAVTDNRTGAMVAAGAMTVTAYDMIENYINGQGLFPQYGSQYGQGGYGGQSGYSGMGRMLRGNQMGRMLRGRGMGYMNPAMQISRFSN